MDSIALSELSQGLPLPPRVRRVTEELAARLGGFLPQRDEQRAGCSSWAPFGFVPLLVTETGTRGWWVTQRADPRRVDRLPLAWWDAVRGELAPLAGRLGDYLALVREGIRYDRPLTEDEALRARVLDPRSARPLIALAGHCLDAGRLADAESWLLRAARRADWWQAPCFLLVGLLRLQGREDEAARWCAEALRRRWDATGAGGTAFGQGLSREPRALLRSAVRFLRRNESSVPGLVFDAAWRSLREAEDPVSPVAHRRAALELARTGRLAEAAVRWEWLALSRGCRESAWRAEQAHEALGWPLHRSHSRLLRLVSAR